MSASLELTVVEAAPHMQCNSCNKTPTHRCIEIGEYDYDYGAATICRACLVEALRMLEAA